jgi:hypothetical protein
MCAILLIGVASHAAAQERDPATAKEESRAVSFIDALDTYVAARSAFDRKEYSTAVVQFERTLALLDDAAMTTRSTAGESAATDLALLTAGFLDLSRALAGDSQSEPASSKSRPSAPRFAHRDDSQVFVDVTL